MYKNNNNEPFFIGNRAAGPEHPCHIVAETGVNHNGDAERAKELLAGAAASGADSVKIQLFTPEELAGPEADLCSYQEQECRRKHYRDQKSLLQSLVLPDGTAEALKHQAESLGIPLWASVFDMQSLEKALALDFPVVKFGSGELTALPLHEKAAETGKPVILSCGMATEEEIHPVVKLYRDNNTPLLLLHCVSAYPAPRKELNLRSIPFLARTFNCMTGFSDHTQGSRAGAAAVACGAVLIEKHLTGDRTLPGPDHRASCEPDQFRAFVRHIRETETMLGSYEKIISPSERETRRKVRKSIMVKYDIQKGHRIKSDDLMFKRPGTGISPILYHVLEGRKTKRAIAGGELLSEKDLET